MMENRILDISSPISASLPVWPGDPALEIVAEMKIADGASANVSRMTMSAHSGTHIDAPLHFFDSGYATDEISLEKLIGEALVIQMDERIPLITEECLQNLKLQVWPRRILFKTVNSTYQNWSRQPFRKDFCALSAGAARFLAEKNVILVGIDYLSIAPFDEPDAVHQILLSAGIVILEGLDLGEISQGLYKLICLPLKIVGIEGAPARAILMDL
jgi:arylformamidase